MLPGPSCWPILNQSPQQWRSTAWSQLAPISSAFVLLMMWGRDSLARRQTGELKTLFISHINILKAFLSLSAHHLIGSSSEKPKQCQKTRVKAGLCWLLVNSTLCIWNLFPRQPDWLIPSVKSREKRDIHVSLPRRIHIETCAIACKHAFSNAHFQTRIFKHTNTYWLWKPQGGIRFEARPLLASLWPHTTSSTDCSPYPFLPPFFSSTSLSRCLLLGAPKP